MHLPNCGLLTFSVDFFSILWYAIKVIRAKAHFDQDTIVSEEAAELQPLILFCGAQGRFFAWLAKINVHVSQNKPLVYRAVFTKIFLLAKKRDFFHKNRL